MTDSSAGTDKHGRPLSAYPERSSVGRLLGINVFGNAAYVDDGTVSLAVLDVADELQIPPRERWLSHEFPLEETGLSTGEYVLYVVSDRGPWRTLTEYGRERVADAGVDPERVVGTVEKRRSAVELYDAIRDADDWGVRAEAAGELRQLAMDAPQSVLGRHTELVGLLDGRDDAEATPDDDPEIRSRTLARRDFAFVLLCVHRVNSSVLDSAFERLVVAAGSEELDDSNDYRRRLLDYVDIRGRESPAETADRLAALLEDDDPETRLRTLYAVYHLEYRYANDSHPLLETSALREAIAARGDDSEPAVRQQTEEIALLHEFH